MHHARGFPKCRIPESEASVLTGWHQLSNCHTCVCGQRCIHVAPSDTSSDELCPGNIAWRKWRHDLLYHSGASFWRQRNVWTIQHYRKHDAGLHQCWNAFSGELTGCDVMPFFNKQCGRMQMSSIILHSVDIFVIIMSVIIQYVNANNRETKHTCQLSVIRSVSSSFRCFRSISNHLSEDWKL